MVYGMAEHQLRYHLDYDGTEPIRTVTNTFSGSDAQPDDQP